MCWDGVLVGKKNTSHFVRNLLESKQQIVITWVLFVSSEVNKIRFKSDSSAWFWFHFAGGGVTLGLCYFHSYTVVILASDFFNMNPYSLLMEMFVILVICRSYTT